MKRKLALCAISLVLIVIMAMAFVACGDKGGDKNGNKPSPIQLTEDLTADEIIDLLPNIKNLTFEFIGGSESNLYTYRMAVSGQGCITKYIYDNYENVYVTYLLENTVTFITVSAKGNTKFIKTLSDEEMEDYSNQLNTICEIIEYALENEWRIENNAFLYITDPTDMEYYDGILIYKNFNTTELDFEYYLSLDIPLLSDSDEE